MIPAGCVVWVSLAGVLTSAGAQSAPEPQAQERCRKGDSAACEAVGFEKKMARDLAKVFAEKDSFKQEERLRKVADVELLVAYFRLCRCSGGQTSRIPPARFADLVTSDPDPDVRSRALWSIEDQALLGRVATTDSSSDVRLQAAQKLKDNAVLSVVAVKDGDARVRLEAVRHLADDTLLAAIARQDGDSAVRLEAIAHLRDSATLARIIGESTDPALLPVAMRSPAVYADPALFEKVLARFPPESAAQASLGAGWWVLEPGSSFHFLPIEPAEGVEALVFGPEGRLRLMAGGAVFGGATYALPDRQTLTITRGEPKRYQLTVTATTMTLQTEKGKAVYCRIPPPF